MSASKLSQLLVLWVPTGQAKYPLEVLTGSLFKSEMELVLLEGVEKGMEDRFPFEALPMHEEVNPLSNFSSLVLDLSEADITMSVGLLLLVFYTKKVFS